jgi:hypothetical protein
MRAESQEGFVLFPRYNEADDRRIGAPDGFERAPADWGDRTSKGSDQAQIAVGSLAFTFQVDRAAVHISPNDLSSGFAKGTDPLRSATKAWVRRLSDLAMTIVRQPLNPDDPSPKVISRPTDRVMTWLSMDGTESWIDTDPGTIEITMPSESPWSERVADPSSIERMVRLASLTAPVPSAVALLDAARTAAHRGRLRLALMEMGTCLEAILTLRLGLASGHKKTLAPLTEEGLRAGVPLPATIDADFVKPRNGAVHNGIDPSWKTVHGGFEVLDPLVASDHGDFICDESLPLAHRPQRFDLHFVTPPVSTGDTSADDVEPI